MKATHITSTTCSVLNEGHRKAYENSEVGRSALLTECQLCENIDEVLAAWGDIPTVILTPEYGENTDPTTEELLLETAGDHEYRLCLMELGVTEDDLQAV